MNLNYTILQRYHRRHCSLAKDVDYTIWLVARPVRLESRALEESSKERSMDPSLGHCKPWSGRFELLHHPRMKQKVDM